MTKPKKPTKKKKNAAAVALSKLAVASMTPEQRQANARKAIAARWAKAKLKK